MKKISIFVLLFLSSLVLVSCVKPKPDPTPDPTPEADTAAPVFTGLVGGKLTAIEHLKGEVVDFLEGVTARDNVTKDSDIVITVKDNAGYNKDVVGKYEFTYEASDEVGNKTTVKRDVTVLETLDIKLDYALVSKSGTAIEAIYNAPEALKLVGTEANFRKRSDVVNVLDKAEFLRQTQEFYPESHAGFAWGNVAILDNDGKLVHMRFAQGAQFEMDAEGNIKSDQADLVWFASHGGGDLLKGIDAAFLDELLPNGGKIVLGGTVVAGQADSARIFLISNLFWSEYKGGGGVYKDVVDVELADRVLTLEKDYKTTIKFPDRLAAPVIEINRHVLTWDAVENASGYQLYIDGEAYGEPSLAREVAMLELDLELTPEGSAGYDVEIVAITNNIFNYSNSTSNKLVYKRIEIITQEKPVLTLTGSVLSWVAPEGAAGQYEVYVTIGASVFFVGEITRTSVNLNEDLIKGYEGPNNKYHVFSYGDNEHSDSTSEKVTYDAPYVLEKMTVNGLETMVAVVNADNYFTRRNISGNGAPANHLFKVTGVFEYKGTMNEAFSSLALIDKNNKVTFVRNIIAGQTYSVSAETTNKWFADSEYAGNNAQLVKLDKYIKAGDSLLIGKNGVTVTFNEVGKTENKTSSARDYLAYHFIKQWPTLGTAGGEGWRGDLTTFVDANTVTVTFS